MNISTINNTTSISATSNKSSAYLDVVNTNQNEPKSSNNVTISEAGKAAAKIDMEGNGSYPSLEMLRVPEWLMDHITIINGKGAGTPYPEETHGKEVSKIPLGNRDEYNKIVQSNYSKNLVNFGIDSTEEHYEALILDKDQSEIIRKSFEAMMDNDPRVIEMLKNT
jgi:hypothetical protein